MSSELPQHLKDRPSAEIVRAHEQWQEALRKTGVALQTMGHVRAPEAIGNIVMPLMAHLDGLLVLTQADQAAYTEQVMGLLHTNNEGPEVIVGLHPDDADTLATEVDEIEEAVTKVAAGLKEGSDQRVMLDGALEKLSTLAEAILGAALEEEDVPEGEPEDDDDEDAEDVPEGGPNIEIPPGDVAEDLADEPLTITG